jgi:putative transposase
MYGAVKKDIVEIFKKLLEMKGVVLIEGKVCRDHVHLYVSIPPKLAVSEFVGYLKLTGILSIEKSGVVDISGQEDTMLQQ